MTGILTRHKRLIGVFAAAVVTALCPGGASAAGERAVHDFMMTPQNGSFYREAPRPASWRVSVEVKAPYPESPRILPMKEVRADFPDEMSFNPSPKMDICADDQIGPPPVNLNVPPEEAIARCPGSVLGNGTSHLYLGGTISAMGPNLEADLVLFNGGRDSAGLPILKMYGFSKSVGAGVYMVGVLDKSILKVSIPYLPFDSAVGDFDLHIPGVGHPVSGRHGLDPAYVRTTCRTGEWNGGAQFTLGTRDTAGNPTSADSVIDGAPLVVPCQGLRGNAKVSVGLRGPSGVRAGRRVPYRIVLGNSGTATAKGLKIELRSRGVLLRRKAVPVPPGQDRAMKVKLRFLRRGTAKVTVKVSGRGVKASSRAKLVTVRR